MVILLESVEQGLPLRSVSVDKEKYMDQAVNNVDDQDD